MATWLQKMSLSKLVCFSEVRLGKATIWKLNIPQPIPATQGHFDKIIGLQAFELTLWLFLFFSGPLG